MTARGRAVGAVAGAVASDTPPMPEGGPDAPEMPWRPAQPLGEARRTAFRDLLDATVPLRILEFRQAGGPTDADRAWARSYADELGAHGDVLQYGGKGAGEVRVGLIRAVAILAYAPGGVTLFGSHWCAGTSDSAGAVCRPDCRRMRAAS